MRFHFGETFQLVLPEDIKTLKRVAPVVFSDNVDVAHTDILSDRSRKRCVVCKQYRLLTIYIKS